MTGALREALEALLAKITAWGDSAVLMVPNVVVAVAVVAVFGVASRFARKFVCRIFTRISDNEPIAQILGQIARVGTIGLGLFMALSVLHLDRTVTSLLAGVGVAGLALGFAFQDTAANLVSGLYMAIRRPIDTGDIIEAAGHMGTVERIELRSTLLKTFDGLSVIIPNKELFQGVVVNYTRTQERRIALEVGVAYSEDLEQVRTVAVEAVEAMDYDESRDVDLYYTGFGDSAINFVLHFWIALPQQPDWLAARSEAIIRIKRAFDAHNITIPFPIRTLELSGESTGRLGLGEVRRSA